MKIALLSRGPSLQVTMPVDQWHHPAGAGFSFDFSIGVNDVALTYETNYACCRDYDAFQLLAEAMHPTLHFLVKDSIGQNCWDFRSDKERKWQAAALAWARLQVNGRIHTHESILFPMYEVGTHPWLKWSGTAALGSAFWLCHRGGRFEDAKGSEIHCYGVDLKGTDSWDGTENTTRGDQRWDFEDSLWRGMVEQIEKYGCKVMVHRLAIGP